MKDYRTTEELQAAGKTLAAGCHACAFNAGWWMNLDGTPRNLEVELADAAIRIFDTAEGLGLDLGRGNCREAGIHKTRADHKPENRARAGGKLFDRRPA